MCGIIGLFNYNLTEDSLNPIVKAVVQRLLLSESLVHMEPRGRDSTGIALLWDDNETAILKQPIPVSDWARDEGAWGEDYTNPDDSDANFSWLMKTWMRGLPNTRIKQALGHVRKKTVGSEYNTHNNHPIIIRPDGVKPGSIGDGTDLLVGVHNGGIHNDDTLFKKYGFNRIGQVDSEIIFQLMYKYKDSITRENLKETFNEIRGAFATMAFNPQQPNIVGCMREVRPLEGVYIPQLGTLMLVSERKFIDTTLEAYDRWRVREANTSFSFVGGSGTEHPLGKVSEVFPYLTCDWYTTITTGVFVLDLNTEVDSKTKAKDLIDVMYINKPAVGTTTRSNFSPYNSNHTSNQVSNTPTAPSKPVVQDNTIGAKSTDPTSFVDLSPYDEVEEVETENTDVVDVECEIAEDDVQDIIDDGCPYSWEERKDLALEALYKADAEGDDRLLICQLQNLDMKEVLGKFLIEVADDDRARVEFASYYSAIFPEGFALGMKYGYSLASDEYDAMVSDEEETDQEKVKGLEHALEAKDKALCRLSKKLEEIENRRKKALSQLATIGPIYRYFLRLSGITDPETNRPDKKRLLELFELAKSSNKAHTVKAAKELMGSTK